MKKKYSFSNKKNREIIDKVHTTQTLTLFAHQREKINYSKYENNQKIIHPPKKTGKLNCQMRSLNQKSQIQP
jgi:hypothetical protein